MRYCLISFLFLIGFSDRLSAGSADPISIIIGDLAGNTEQTIYFPGGTTFRVTNGIRQPLEPRAYTPGTVVDEGDLILQVFPSYRPERTQVFDLQQKQLLIFTTDEVKRRNAGSGITDTCGRYIGEVKATSKLTSSTKIPGTYHFRLTLSNGIVFTCEDGQS